MASSDREADQRLAAMRELDIGAHTIVVSSSCRIVVERLIVWDAILPAVERFLVRQGDNKHLLVVAGDDAHLTECSYLFAPPFIMEKNGRAELDVTLVRPVRFLACLVGVEL